MKWSLHIHPTVWLHGHPIECSFALLWIKKILLLLGMGSNLRPKDACERQPATWEDTGTDGGHLTSLFIYK